ncbi:hypothetical protein ACQ1ZG_14855, partial [Enterococcus faecalis]|uniref:hypothetical protein n=1 Tax=Enterococcus faecalis TaxID=1351 RepID=UPI003D6B18B9
KKKGKETGRQGAQRDGAKDGATEKKGTTEKNETEKQKRGEKMQILKKNGGKYLEIGVLHE